MGATLRCGAWALGTGASAAVVHGRSCMWNLPGPGLEPMSPALEGRFLITVPPGKSQNLLIFNCLSLHPQPSHRTSAHHKGQGFLFYFISIDLYLVHNTHSINIC